MIKGVIFDLDGVITDTVEYHYKAWNYIAKEEFNGDIPWEFNENLKGVDRMESLNRILRLFNVENKYTEEEKKSIANKKNDYYVDLIQKVKEEDLLDGIKELLLFLKKKNIKMVIGSASKNAPTILKGLNVYDLFDAIVDPASVKGKPNPDIFLKGAELVGLKPEECIGVEDSYSGIEAINKAGMLSIGVGSKDVLNEANYVVKDTSKILELVQSII